MKSCQNSTGDESVRGMPINRWQYRCSRDMPASSGVVVAEIPRAPLEEAAPRKRIKIRISSGSKDVVEEPAPSGVDEAPVIQIHEDDLRQVSMNTIGYS